MHVYLPCEHQAIKQLWFGLDPETRALNHCGASEENVSLIEGASTVKVCSKGVRQDGGATQLEIECCPPKVLQRHNVFGHSSLQDYVLGVADLVTDQLGIKIEKQDKKSWRDGNVKVTGVHLTANFKCPAEYVVSIIDAIDENTRYGKRRDREGHIALGYRERRSKYHVLSAYNKWDELRRSFGNSPGPIRQELMRSVCSAIRLEVKLFSQYLSNPRRPLNRLCYWSDVNVEDLYFEILERYDLPSAIQPKLTLDEIAMLTTAEKRVYQLWLAGIDVKDQYNSRTTVNRYTETIQEKTGINVKARRRPDALPEIDLESIFCRENIIPVPDWLVRKPKYLWRP